MKEITDRITTRAAPDVLTVSARLVRVWENVLTSAELAELRHDGGARIRESPRKCCPLPPDRELADLLPDALNAAAALGYTVARQPLPGPWTAVAGFTCREHAAIVVNPERPGAARYEDDARLLEAETTLNLLHELAHVLDPVDYGFAHPGPQDPAEQRAALLAEAVACLAAEALVMDAGVGLVGGGQVRYLVALLHCAAPLGNDETAAVRQRAAEVVRLLNMARVADAWVVAEGGIPVDHVLTIGSHVIPLSCGAAAHGGDPPHQAAAAAARWSRLRAAELARKSGAATC